MASNSNNHNLHPEYNPNIRIKAEPGMDSESSSSVSTTTSDSSVNSLLANVKTEPGFSAPTARLQSIRPKRDLTLGANQIVKQKKVFVPNINVRRLKDREDQNSTSKSDASSGKERVRSRDRGKHERGRDNRSSRGRGKALNNLIQSSGVFSEGLADTPGSRRSSSYSSYRERDSSGSERESIQRPKLSLDRKVDKAEEDHRLKMLLRDDFIADSMDVDENNAPLTLPMFDEAKVFAQNNYKIDGESDRESIKSDKLPNGEVKERNKVQPLIAPKIAKEAKVPLTVTQVLERNNKSNNFILLQLPDCLPGLRGTDDDAPGNPKTKNDTAEPSKENETEKSSNYCSLGDLKEGMLGKLQIMKSGKTRLILGDNNLIVELGSTVSFRQDLIAAKVSSEEQDLVNLGRVNSTLICAPDWEDLLKIL